MSGERLIVVEDEEHLAEVIADNLELEGYEVEVVVDGALALERIREAEPALVLLDVMLPGVDGFTICDTLRREGRDVPILFLTARSTQDDRVRGLELGGDDFLGKPFDLRELMLRVKAILKRTSWFQAPSAAGETLVLGTARIDFKRYVATLDGRELQLSAEGDDDPALPRGTARRSRLARGHPRPRVGLQRLPDRTHDRQLHRAPAPRARARSAGAALHPHRAWHGLSTHRREPLAAPRASRARSTRRTTNMNSSNRLLMRALRREIVERPPVWLMRQAGRYLPEYRATRQQAGGFMEMIREPKYAAEVTLQPIRRYGMDAAILFSDILVPLEAMGMALKFDEHGPSLPEPLRTREAIDGLRLVDPGETMGFVGEALRLTRAGLPEETALLGFCGAPFTLAAYAVEGGGTKQFSFVRKLMYRDFESFSALMDKLARTSRGAPALSSGLRRRRGGGVRHVGGHADAP